VFETVRDYDFGIPISEYQSESCTMPTFVSLRLSTTTFSLPLVCPVLSNSSQVSELTYFRTDWDANQPQLDFSSSPPWLKYPWSSYRKVAIENRYQDSCLVK